MLCGHFDVEAKRYTYLCVYTCTCTHTHKYAHTPARYLHVCVQMYLYTLKCIIIETRADSVAVKSNGLKPVLAAIMHPGRLF
jgi:hypothetical protein